MEDRERGIKEQFVSTIMEQNWSKRDILFELLQHIPDLELDNLWRDLSLSRQEEELQEREAA